MKSFEFVKTLSQVGDKLSWVGGKVLKSDVEVEDLYFFEFCVKPIFQGGKNKEKFENVPKFPRLISWCMDIIRGSHLKMDMIIYLLSKTDKTSRCPTENQYDDVRNVVSGNPLPGTS